jgi:hypothetical protein
LLLEARVSTEPLREGVLSDDERLRSIARGVFHRSGSVGNTDFIQDIKMPKHFGAQLMGFEGWRCQYTGRPEAIDLLAALPVRSLTATVFGLVSRPGRITQAPNNLTLELNIDTSSRLRAIRKDFCASLAETTVLRFDDSTGHKGTIGQEGLNQSGMPTDVAPELEAIAASLPLNIATPNHPTTRSRNNFRLSYMQVPRSLNVPRELGVAPSGSCVNP